MGILKYTKDHEWANIDGNAAVVGISDHAQKELGDIVFVELPKVGDSIKQFSQFGTVESTKAASELFSPLSGEVLEINEELINNPQWVNEDPQGKGWMIKIKIKDQEEASSLMDEAAYAKYVEEEERK